jgi:hypothetical protein
MFELILAAALAVDPQQATIAKNARPGSSATVRNQRGQVTMRATTSGKTTTFRNSSGRSIGTAQQSGSVIRFRDSSGRSTGTVTVKKPK